MSIHDLWGKIKGKTGVDNFVIMYLFIVVGVGISAFGLGRLSVGDTNTSKDISISQTASSIPVVPATHFKSNVSSRSNTMTDTASSAGIEKNYVASKHGKLYYTNGCAGAKRIKSENEVWFSTASDAEKAGYSPSTSCK